MICGLLALLASLAPIVGGGEDTGDPAVVAIDVGGGQCSGVVVAPRVVVTAAHCIAPGPGTVDVGGVVAIVDRVWVDRYYTGDVDHDLAVLHLDRDAQVTPLAIASPVIGPVRLVGFGATFAGGPRGIRHAVDTALTSIAAHQARAGGSGSTTCTGDSGGAALDPGGALVGVIAAGDDSCTAASFVVRPDAEPQLAEVIAAWSGSCPADGTCMTGCGDPDCDPCAFQGTCAPACPAVDLDCPLGALAGETCASADSCESRSCAGDVLGRFCSAPCATAADCPAPLDACRAGLCGYSGGTPGIAGARCHADADCRSGLCDLDAAICTIPCGPGGSCPGSLACAPVRDQLACTASGGCAVASGGTWMIFVIGVLAYLLQSRHTRRACRCSMVSKSTRPRSTVMAPARHARS